MKAMLTYDDNTLYIKRFLRMDDYRMKKKNTLPILIITTSIVGLILTMATSFFVNNKLLYNILDISSIIMIIFSVTLMAMFMFSEWVKRFTSEKENCDHTYKFIGYSISKKNIIECLEFNFKCVACGKTYSIDEYDLKAQILDISEKIKEQEERDPFISKRLQSKDIRVPSLHEEDISYSGESISLVYRYYERLGIDEDELSKIYQGLSPSDSDEV